MDTGDWIAIASAIAAVVAVIVALRALRYPILLELIKDYKQPDMPKAANTLWEFYRQFDENKEQIAVEFNKLLNESKDNHVNVARRRVSHFYNCMAMLSKANVIPKSHMYRLWSEKDLRIIPDIIIPLEETLIKSHGEEVGDELELLLALYNNSTKLHYEKNCTMNLKRGFERIAWILSIMCFLFWFCLYIYSILAEGFDTDSGILLAFAFLNFAAIWVVYYLVLYIVEGFCNGQSVDKQKQ